MMMAHDCNESYLVYVSVFSFGAMGIPRQAAALSDSEGSPKRGWKCRPVSILEYFFYLTFYTLVRAAIDPPLSYLRCILH